MVLHHVVPQVVPSNEAFAANGTLVRPLFSVHLEKSVICAFFLHPTSYHCMVLQMDFGAESLVAVAACEGFFARVDGLVALQVAFFYKRLVALVAREWSFTCNLTHRSLSFDALYW